MADGDNRELIGELLLQLRDGLQPFVEEVLAPNVPANRTWTVLLEERDRVAGRTGRYATNDLQSLLSAMTGRLGSLGFPFTAVLGSRATSLLPEELRKVRNDWAHMADFSDEDTDRALDSGARLLRAIGAPQAAAADGALLAYRQKRYAQPAAQAGNGAADPRASVQVEQPPYRDLPIPPHQRDAEPAQAGTDTGAPEPAPSEIPPAPISTVVRIDAETLTTLSYAMAHNAISPISSIELTSTEDVRGAVLEIVLRQDSGPIGAPQQYFVDLVSDRPTLVPVRRFVLDGSAMLGIDSPRPGHFDLSVRIGDRVLGAVTYDVDLLAAQQWRAVPFQLGLEMLPAHVTPHHPLLRGLLVEAAEILRERTGSASLDAYQAADERVDDIARAISLAIQRRNVRYANPPASWGDGQIIRTVDEVLDGGLGTCLDTTVVLAAALEQAGIDPILLVYRKHANIGYWRNREVHLTDEVLTDANTVVTLIDAKHIGAIETTLLTDEAPLDFEDQQARIVTAHFRGSSIGDFEGAVDVAGARRVPVLPLPVRTTAPEGGTVVTQYAQVAPVLPVREEVRGSAAPSVSRDEPERVTRWKGALLDLSLRNRLLNFTDTARLPLLLPQGAAAEVEDLLHAGRTISLIPNDRITKVDQYRGDVRTAAQLDPATLIARLRNDRTAHVDLSSVTFSSRMLRLANNARTIAEETGANNLYLAVGSLLWDVKGKAVRSPLILIPVSLKSKSRGESYSLTLDESGGSTPNFCLIEKLRQEMNLSIPELENPEQDDSGIDIDGTLKAVRQALIAKNLPFQVEDSLDLAILQFAKFRLWKDLDEHWSEFANNALVNHLLRTPDLPFQQAELDAPDLDALAALCPISADASQLAAVAGALQGRTFVLEGPPGTGKSQTITNLLARAIAEGKKVLFVAEKRAALEVVQRRLEGVGLAPFTLDLHDKASRLNELRRQLRESLDASIDVDRNALDSASSTVRRTTASLARYARSVHEPNGLGLSLYGARQRQLSLHHAATALELSAADVRSLSEDQIRTITRALEAASGSTPPARPHPRHGWSFVDDDSARRADPAALLAAAERMEAAVRGQQDGPLRQAIGRVIDPSDLLAAARVFELTDVPPLDFIERAGDPRWRASSDEAIAKVRVFATTDHAVLRDLDRSGLDLPLEQLRDDAQTAAATGFLGRKKRLRAVAGRFGTALSAGAQAPAALKQLPALAQAAIDVRTAHDAAKESVFSVQGLAAEAGDPFDAGWADRLAARRNHLVDVADRAAAVTDASPFHAYVRDALRRRVDVPADLATRLRALAAAISGLREQLDADPTAWLGDDGWADAWIATAADRALDRSGSTTLLRWLQHLEGLRPILLQARTPGLRAFVEALADGSFPIEDAPEAFELAVASASVEERTVATQLDDFSASLQDDTIERYRRGLDDIQHLLPEAMPNELLATRRFDAAASTGQVGRLRRELERQRGGLPIRRLLEEFHDLILSITPCVLVSPESVARFFPADRSLFDLVVFDEASQVRVADAIGAMGRSSSVVVVGDSKQMPPSTFAQAGGGVDDETGLTASGDEESILTECVRAQVPSDRLTWHYRSRHEALIAFSNEHYYDSKLASFPSPRSSAHDQPVIDFVRVPGEFLRSATGKEKRTNPVEAEAIVAEVERQFAASPDTVPSVGIVTFNKEQRDLVETLLRQAPDDRVGEALDEKTEGLFVKNLENVQGDERDTILFSIAFSKNERGALPLNFGPLTQSGGERRLNVAVTRARAQVVLFCSFDPSDLRAEETQSVGIKHLRDYLRLAQQGRPDALAMKRRPRPDVHRDDIAAALQERGLVVLTDVGLSDFRIDVAVADRADPESDLVAILLDTPEWNGRRTVHDRDVLPAAVLGGSMQWRRVVRVWLPEWLADREGVLSRIEAVVDAAKSQPVASAPAARPERTFAVAGSGVKAAAQPAAPRRAPDYETRFARFVPWTVRGAGNVDVLNDLPRPAAGRRVGEVLSNIVRHEGPIHRIRLARLAAAEFGLNRVNNDRIAAILRQLDPSHMRQGDQSHAWPGDLDPRTWTAYRWSAMTDERDLRSVSPIEFANAMRHISEESAGIEEEPLFREVLTRFGAKRLTEDVAEMLRAGLGAGVRTGRVRRSASGAILPQ